MYSENWLCTWVRLIEGGCHGNEWDVLWVFQVEVLKMRAERL